MRTGTAPQQRWRRCAAGSCDAVYHPRPDAVTDGLALAGALAEPHPQSLATNGRTLALADAEPHKLAHTLPDALANSVANCSDAAADASANAATDTAYTGTAYATTDACATCMP